MIENELRKMPKNQKSKFDQIMMSGNGQSGGFLSALLGAIGIPMIMKLLGSGLHNSPTGGYKTHRKKIPIPSENQPVVKQNEGTGLNDWQIYNPPPFNEEHEIIQRVGLKKRSKSHGEGLLFGNSKNNPFRNVPLLNILF